MATKPVHSGRVEWGREGKCRILLFAEDHELLETGEWGTGSPPAIPCSDGGYFVASFMLKPDGVIFRMTPLVPAEWN